MRICTKCQKDLSESDFYVKYKKTGEFHSNCKNCMNEQKRDRYRADAALKGKIYTKIKDRRKRQRLENRQRYFAYLKKQECFDCHIAGPEILTCDHLNPDKKSANVSVMVQAGYSWETILAEIAKCQIVCCNCHARRTAKSQGWYDDLK